MEPWLIGFRQRQLSVKSNSTKLSLGMISLVAFLGMERRSAGEEMKLET
jgi:hypothetical protein